MFSQFTFKQAFVAPGTIGGNPVTSTDDYGRMNVNSANGDIVFVSAPRKTVLGVSSAGEIYVYKTNDNWNSPPTLLNTITEVSPGTNREWGTWMDVSDDGFTLAVCTSTTTSAYIVRPSVAGDWTSTPVIIQYDNDPSSVSSYVSISGNGNMAITSQYQYTDMFTVGRVKIFKSPYTGVPFATLNNPDMLLNTNFASNAILSQDGTRIVASAPFKNGTGSVFVFTATDTTWTSYSTVEIVNPTMSQNMGIFLESGDSQLSRFIVGYQTGFNFEIYVFISADNWLTPSVRIAGPFTSDFQNFSGGTALSAYFIDTVGIVNTEVNVDYPNSLKCMVELYKTTDDWYTWNLDQVIDSTTVPELPNTYLAYGLSSISNDNTDMILGDFRTPQSYVFQRNVNPPGPPGPPVPPGPILVPANELYNYMLKHTDSINGVPGLGHDASHTNGWEVQNAGTPARDGQYSVLQIGSNRGFGKPASDNRWSNVVAGLFVYSPSL